MKLARPLDERASGVLLHISSLPGPHGIGDFGPAAFHFIDWLASAGQTMWQLLPMMPIGPGNSPYQSVSAFAGSPLMVALEPLLERGWLHWPDATAALPEGGFDAGRVDFGRVVPWRLAQLRAAAAGFFATFANPASGDAAKPAGNPTADQAAFSTWCAAQARWLDDYTLFMALEAAHPGLTWPQWDAALARRDAGALAAARAEHADEIAFWQFVQWCFDTQWAAVRTHAHAHGIAVMGDLPIFVAHHSADCWARPDLYHLDAAFQPTVVAGVPPDFFSASGQRWGNPLYHWERMAAENYGWWVERTQRALAQADLFRIDHFRGFAGYWEIPAACPTAIDGRWVTGPGKPLFDAIEAAVGRVPVVAEDLGVITDDVLALRDGCGFPGMRILHFAFGDNALNAYLPHNFAAHTVAYSGTHDNDTTRGWWNAASERERRYAALYLGAGELSSAADAAEAAARAEADLPAAVIRTLMASTARLVIFPMQDVLGLGSDARMNTPGTMDDANWAWRFDWADVGAAPAQQLRALCIATGRAPFDARAMLGAINPPAHPAAAGAAGAAVQ